ncbi:unnamed protein product, partial [Prorocentrum cordatum]
MTWPPVTLLRGAALPLWALGAAAPAAADAFDCEAGKGHWRDGWSEQKKEWCCSQGSSAGCGGDGGRQAVFRFVGFGDAREARRACKYSAGVAMPKSQGEVDEFKRMLDEARRVGNLTDRWPRNTVWLGGSWDFESKKWQWDDGTDIGKHWAAKNHLDHLGRSGTLQRRDKKEREPWLCTEVMSGPWPAGQWQDSHARHEFGIVCQEWLEATTTRTMVTTTSATDVSLTTGTLVTRPKPFDCRQFRLHWKAWGVNPSSNPWIVYRCHDEFQKKPPGTPEYSRRLGLLYGAFFGLRVLQEPRRYTRYGQVKDDVERSLRYWHLDGVLLRFRRYAVRKTHTPGKFNLAKGGISAGSSAAKHRAEASRALAQMFGEFAAQHARLPAPGERAPC